MQQHCILGIGLGNHFRFWNSLNILPFIKTTFATLMICYRAAADRNQFPQELWEPLTCLTIFHSLSWTITMIQHLISLPRRRVCNSSLRLTAAKEPNCFESVQNCLNQTNQLWRSDAGFWLQTLGFQHKICLQRLDQFQGSRQEFFGGGKQVSKGGSHENGLQSRSRICSPMELQCL
jgi:hypothetical protein